MALAEARAAWQRTANRFLVQEDAKRAPKLACCPSIRSSTNAASDVNKPIAESIKPFDSSYSSLSPNSKWWLQMQPNHRYHGALVDQQLNSTEDKICLVDQTKFTDSSCDDRFRDLKYADKKETYMSDYHVEEVDVGELRNNDVNIYVESDKDCEPCLDSSKYDRTTWCEKSSPRWRTADAEELALLVAQSLVDQVENCDLPWPRNNRLEKVSSLYGICSLSFDEDSCSYGVGRVSKDLMLPPKNQTLAVGDKPSRNHPTRNRTWDAQVSDDDDKSKAQILEALRHSQTRAREAEKAAKLVCQEKERILALLLRQASQIFVYKQWLHHLQLENTNLQLRNKKGQSSSSVSLAFPVTLPLKPQTRGRKLPKNTHTLTCKT